MGTQDQGGGGKVGRQRLQLRQLRPAPQPGCGSALGASSSPVHQPLASILIPPLYSQCHRAGPTQQAGGGRKRHRDRQGTAWIDCSSPPGAGPMRLHSQSLIQGGHLRRLSHPWGHRPILHPATGLAQTGRLSGASQSLAPCKPAPPHCGQWGHNVGCRARPVSTASTSCMARTRPNDQTARINAVNGVGVFRLGAEKGTVFRALEGSS